MNPTRTDCSGVEFAVLHFHFECARDTTLTLQGLLQLRRELHRTARALFALEGNEASAQTQFQALFDPPLAIDPVAQRRYQRPGPPFVLAIDPAAARDYQAGSTWELKVVFWGQGGQLAGDFARVLQALARAGFGPGIEGGELVAIETEDASGERCQIWQEGQPLQRLTPIYCELDWRLANWPQGADWRLEFLTPARLLSSGRPLFRPDFAKMFPFILRRVTSMCHAHCGQELLADPGPLLQAAPRVEQREKTLLWTDWRSLDRGTELFDLGGLMGGVTLSGEALDEVVWVLQVGSLLNLGKGAAFGAGAFQLTPC